MAKTIIHTAATRGFADHGWLKSHQTFSFSGYYDPKRMHFGALRVLNDDLVAGSRGFGEHPHDNMEIISIPLEGELIHRDSMGNEAVIKQGEIQAMSAGTGIYHSEYNKNEGEPVKFLQIWLFPNKRNVEPRYDQVKIDIEEKNKFHQILSPNQGEAGVWIHQNAWFHMGNLNNGTEIAYQLKDKANGVYAFIIKGSVDIDGNTLNERDGMGIWETETFTVKANGDAQVLLMEVPMLA